MVVNKLKELVENSQELNPMQRNHILGFISRAEEMETKYQYDRDLVEAIAKERKPFEVVLSNERVKIYKVTGKDEWDTKYPFRSILCNEKGVWEKCSTVSPTFDLAFLTYLEKRHIGLNSQFVEFAAKMLEIKID